MARITVEGCEKVIGSRFDLVVLAAQRTRQILAGDNITVEDKDGKKPTIALREIEAQTVSIDALEKSAIKSFRSFTLEEDLDEKSDYLMEEDTYNPYAGIEISSLESDKISIVKDSDLEAELESELELEETIETELDEEIL